MKKKILYIIAGLLLVTISCEQEVIELEAPPPPAAACNSCPSGSSSGANVSFTKFVSIGNGFVAGFQAGALFNNGQTNSMAKLLAGQLQCAGGSATFNQPDINSVNGYNLQSSIPGVITLGRLILFDPDGPTGPRSAAPFPAGFPGSAAVTCPSAVPATPALPAPYNTADLPGAFTGNKATINNYGVPLIYLGQVLTPATGNPGAGAAYNPLWARFAQSPGTKSILQEAMEAQGSFYLVWVGLEDALLDAATGRSNTFSLTSTSDFNTQFNGLIATMLTGTTLKGVVGNIPSLSSFPYFTTVPWNTIKLDAATASSLTTNLANGYNAFLDAMVSGGHITAEERTKRRLTYIAGNNGVLLTDETLTDLTPFMNANPSTQPLIPYARARQATATDLVPLAAGSILGTCVNNNPQAVQGVSWPVSDRNMLTFSEIVEIETAIGGYNAIISAAVAGSNNRLALADIKTAYGNLLTSSITTKGIVVNGVTLTSSFAPPTGIFSEDGLHPNNRGNAFTANIFIDAINAKFTGATVPKICMTQYGGTLLPINP